MTAGPDGAAAPEPLTPSAEALAAAAWALALFAGTRPWELGDGTPIDLRAIAETVSRGAYDLARAQTLRDQAVAVCERRTKELAEARRELDFQRERAESYKRRARRYEAAMAELPPDAWPEFRGTAEPHGPAVSLGLELQDSPSIREIAARARALDLGPVGIKDAIRSVFEVAEREPAPDTIALPDTPQNREIAARVEELNAEFSRDRDGEVSEAIRKISAVEREPPPDGVIACEDGRFVASDSGAYLADTPRNREIAALAVGPSARFDRDDDGEVSR